MPWRDPEAAGSIVLRSTLVAMSGTGHIPIAQRQPFCDIYQVKPGVRDGDLGFLSTRDLVSGLPLSGAALTSLGKRLGKVRKVDSHIGRRIMWWADASPRRGRPSGQGHRECWALDDVKETEEANDARPDLCPNTKCYCLGRSLQVLVWRDLLGKATAGRDLPGAARRRGILGFATEG
jgi:hypothetical protein